MSLSTRNNNYAKTQTKKKQQNKSNKNTKFINNWKKLQYVELYHIDSIYAGHVNFSHYKQGFGMLQTIKFHTFLGNFKNGRAEGLGLIVLNSGAKVYGNFIKDELTGIGLVDDGTLLKIGVWTKLQLNGIGYEYSYNGFMWRMVRYHKGVVCEVLKQQISNLQGKMPTLMNLQHSLYFFLLNYLSYNFFKTQKNNHSKSYQQQQAFKQNQDQFQPGQQKQNGQQNSCGLSSLYVHQQVPCTVHFGMMKQKRQFGLGIKFNKKDNCVTQAGYYQNGKINGFGYKNNNAIRHKQTGLYIDDKKQGLFMHDDSGKITYCLYHENVFVEGLQIAGSDFIKKKQKQYNYNKKTFISNKNTLDLDQYEIIVQKLCQNKQPYFKLKAGSTAKEELEKILQKRQNQDLKGLFPTKANQVKVKQNEKTSVSLLKEKFKIFTNAENIQEELRLQEKNSSIKKSQEQRRNQTTKQEKQSKNRVSFYRESNNINSSSKGQTNQKSQALQSILKSGYRRKQTERQLQQNQQPIAQQENPFVFQNNQTDKGNFQRKQSSSFFRHKRKN